MWTKLIFELSQTNWVSKVDFQFIGHLSVQSVMQYILSLIPPDLQSMEITRKTGFLIPTAVTFRNHSPTSAATPPDLCLRLTPNVVDLMGPLGLTGSFFQNFLAVCFSLVDPHCKFEAFLAAILQDVLVLEDRNLLVSFSS